MKIWSCKIGECDAELLPEGADAPMRAAVERAYRELTGFDAAFNFSGWGAELDESERAVVENREPSEEHYRHWLIQQAAPDLYEALADASFYLKSLGARLAALDLDNTETYGCLQTATLFARYLDAALSKVSQQQGTPQAGEP